uniref:Uncharacterized protein n=1 Tax=Anguilla anguilla TaxID=7936 RepID=A0A0E9S1V7_ANGAN
MSDVNWFSLLWPLMHVTWLPESLLFFFLLY